MGNLMVSPVSNMSIPAKKFSTPPLLSSITEEKFVKSRDEEKLTTFSSPAKKLPSLKEYESTEPNPTSQLEEKSEHRKIILSDTTPFYIPKDLEVPTTPSENI